MTEFMKTLSFEPYHPYSPWLLSQEKKREKSRKGKRSGGINKTDISYSFYIDYFGDSLWPEKNIWARRNFLNCFFKSRRIDCPLLIGREGTASLSCNRFMHWCRVDTILCASFLPDNHTFSLPVSTFHCSRLSSPDISLISQLFLSICSIAC